MIQPKRLVVAAASPVLLAVDLFLAVVVVVVGAPLWLLPWNAASRLGRFYGRCGFFLWPVARRAGMMNLKRAYGDAMTYRRARAETMEVFANLGQSIAEGIQFSRKFRSGDGRWEDLYEAEDPTLEKRLLADPRPRIFVTGHLGSWEIAMAILGLRFPEKGAVIARRVDNPFVNALVRRLRLTKDSQWIEKSGAAGEAYERLKSGESIAMLLDENAGPRGPFVRFFGRPASTRKTAAVLSLATGAPVVIGAAVRHPATGRFVFRLATIEPEGRRSCNPTDAILGLTQEIVRVYEEWVRDDPLQWRWIHWRWRSRPGGAEETYRRRDLKECFSRSRPASAGEPAQAAP
jgi:Kdo2-lipid IVA lauroyltransferase/acyltransferase